jgi:hypothetical protein
MEQRAELFNDFRLQKKVFEGIKIILQLRALIIEKENRRAS